MKSFGTPPEAVARVASAVMVLLAKKGKIPKDRSWKAAKVDFYQILLCNSSYIKSLKLKFDHYFSINYYI